VPRLSRSRRYMPQVFREPLRWDPTMRQLGFLAFALWVQSAAGAAIPDLVCQELRVVQVDPRSLQAQESKSRTLYRLKSGNLYLSSTDRPEYLYNTVVEVEPMRYVSGHKTLQFESADFRAAIFVHSYRDEVRVSRANCRRT
jgi:hypothetical protein